MKRFFNWLADKISPQKASPRVAQYRHSGDTSQTRQSTPSRPAKSNKPTEPDFVEFDSSGSVEIDSAGPGKNVLRRSKFVREKNGTQDTLSIVGESNDPPSADDDGIDPYNTGQFDRSKNWDKRFRKD